MAVTVSASTAGVMVPPVVQVVVEGLTVGAVASVVARTGGSSRVVRGRSWVASSSQLVVVDELAAINAATVYEVRVGGALAATSAPVVVPFAGDYLLQSVDGSVSLAPVSWRRNGLPRSVRVDQHLTYVPGRPRPVLRFAAAGGVSGAWEVRTDRAGSRVMEALLGAGAPLVLRTDGQRRDLDAVMVVALTAGDSQTWDAIEPGTGRLSDHRVWQVSWVDIDDPLIDVASSGDTFADVDAAHAGSTFADLDAAYAGSTFGDWNRTDWEGLGA